MNKMIKYITILLLAVNMHLYSQDNLSKRQNQEIRNNKSDFFIENKGQWTSEVRYLARINGLNAWITNYGVVYDYFKIIKNKESEPVKSGKNHKESDENQRVKGHVIKMTFINSQAPVKPSNDTITTYEIQGNEHSKYNGNEKLEGYYNYFIGNDSTKWTSFVQLFKEVIVKDIYKGIHVRYYLDKDTEGKIILKYDFVFMPGADINQVKIKFEGADSISIDNNVLVLHTSLADIRQTPLNGFIIEDKTILDDLSPKDLNIKTLKKSRDITDIHCIYEKNPDETIGITILEK
jgi:hypothetical protein